MANYYTLFCGKLILPTAEAATHAHALYERLSPADDDDFISMGFDIRQDETEPNVVYLEAGGNADLSAVESFVHTLAKELGLTGLWSMAWCEFCDKSRPDGFGGGLLVISLSQRKTIFFKGTHTLSKEYQVADLIPTHTDARPVGEVYAIPCQADHGETTCVQDARGAVLA